MSQKVTALEQEIERLTDGAELENVSHLKTLTPPFFFFQFKFKLPAIFVSVLKYL